MDIAAISGSGWMGRVTKDDILQFIEEREQAPAVGGAAPSRVPAAPSPGGGFGWEEFYTHVEHPTVEIGPRDRVEPMNRMTSLIAEHMVISRRISPHVHSYFEVDYSRVDQIRAQNRQHLGGAGNKGHLHRLPRPCGRHRTAGAPEGERHHLRGKRRLPW